MKRLEVRRRSTAVLFGLTFASLLACSSGPPPGAVYVERRPPPARVEVVTRSPGSGYAWIGGYWRWGGNDYDWVPGRWVVPERGYRRWEAGRWIHKGHRWYWVEGRWRR